MASARACVQPTANRGSGSSVSGSVGYGRDIYIVRCPLDVVFPATALTKS
jgi:hypothetical protein